MHKFFLYIILSIINIFLLLIAYFRLKEKINPLKFKEQNIIRNKEIFKRVLENNNQTKEETEKYEYFINIYNISLFSDNEIINDFNYTLNNFPSNITLEDYSLLIQKKYFLLNLLKMKSTERLIYFNNSFDENEFYDSFSEFKNSKNFTYSHRFFVDFCFYKGKNLTSNKDILIFEGKKIFRNETIFWFSNLDDIIFEMDNQNNLFKIKIPNAIINNNFFQDINNCFGIIQIVFKLDYYSLNVTKDNNSINLNISTIKSSSSDMIIISKCLKYILWFSYKGEFFIENNNGIYESLDNLKNGYKIFLNLLLSLFSIINLIYFFKFMNNISKKLISIHTICPQLFSIIYVLNFFYFFESINTISLLIKGNDSWIIKFIWSFSVSLSFINIIINIFFLNYLLMKISKEQSCEGCLTCYYLFLVLIANYLFVFSFMIVLFFENRLLELSLIIECLLWIYQIINNIIYKNIYTFPLLYVVFIPIYLLLTIYFINDFGQNSTITLTKKILIFLANIIEIVIIYIQRFFGPRFMLGKKGQEKTIYKTKKELLKEKPNSKIDNCSICLAPMINDINYINNNRSTNNNSNINKLNNTLKIRENIFEKIESNTFKEFKDNQNNINNSINELVIKEINNGVNLRKLNNKKCDWKKLTIKIKDITKKLIWDFQEYNPNFLKIYVLLSCGHYFHVNCLRRWINVKKICPICRRKIPEI